MNAVTNDLVREAHGLAEEIRRLRPTDGVLRGNAPRDVPAMEARLTELWTAIRVSRASGGAPEDGPALRRSRPKWQ